MGVWGREKGSCEHQTLIGLPVGLLGSGMRGFIVGGADHGGHSL